MSSKEYVISRVISRDAGIEVSEEDIHCILVNANDKSFIQDRFGEIPVCSTGSVVYRINHYGVTKSIFTDSEMDQIRDALLRAHSPIEATPDVDFDLVSELLHDALVLIEKNSSRKQDDIADSKDRAAIQDETLDVKRPVQIPIVGVVGLAASMLGIGLLGGMFIGARSK